jgi:uncharacterized protein YjbI with pentapeptide repeats
MSVQIIDLLRETLLHPTTGSNVVYKGPESIVLREGGQYPGIQLIEMDLSGCSLRRVNLSNASFSGSNLSGVDLSGSILTGVDFKGADISGAKFDGATLDKSNIESALYTIPPSGISVKQKDD